MVPASRKIIPVWKTTPMLRLVLPLVAGIVLCHFFSGVFWNYLLLAGCILTSTAFLVAYRYPLYFGLSLGFLWVAIGGFLYFHSWSYNQKAFIGDIYSPGSICLVKLLEPLDAKPKSWRSIGAVQVYDSASQTWQPLAGKVILYFSKENFSDSVGLGTHLLIKKPLQIIKNSGNPGSFDYVFYAASNDWYYQIYLQRSEYKILTTHTALGWQHWPYVGRQYLLSILKEYIPHAKTLGVAEALLTGYRNNMDKELAWQYAATGVSHVIAISGLHLGIIQVGLLFLLSPLKKIRGGNKIRGLSVIALVWIFALTSGASPSVLRAAFMFTLLLVGDLIGRKGNPYNNLCISAFLLLLYQPNLLFNVGFQLSYAAVLSIFLFYKPILGLLLFSNKWVYKIWSMVSITLAAQILTTPFVLFYFKQFPLYFLLANLVAIPLSTIALYLCLLLTMFVWFHPVAVVLGKLVHFSIVAINASIETINGFPFSRIENISLSLPEAFVIFTMVLLLAVWFLLNNKKAGIAGLACFFGLILFREWKWQKSGQQMLMVVYNIPNNTAIDFITGNKAVFWGDSACLNNPTIYRNQIVPARIFFKINKSTVGQKSNTDFVQYQISGRKILLLDKPLDLRTSQKIETDILVVATGLKLKPIELIKLISARHIIVDGKMPFYRIKEWQNAADSLHLHLHSTLEKGAYVFDFKQDEN